VYSQVDDSLVRELVAIVGNANVLTAPQALEPYSHDETAGLRAEPEVVVKPACTEEVAQVLRLANERRVPVTPRTGGYGLSGGAVPVCGGIVLSLERMNRIIEIDHENLMVTAQVGVITGNLHRAVEQEGLFYPPDPASSDSCCLGGNIAHNAGGPRAVKYGVTRDYVCGLEAVLPTGEILHLGGKRVKDVTGYNLIQLIVGSEGTLAVVTSVILRLLPLLPERVDLLVPFDSFAQAANTVAEIIRQRVIPTTIEFMERDAVHASERMLGKEVPYHDATALLLIQIDARTRDEVDSALDQVGEICLAGGALDVLVAQDRPTRERLWEARKAVLEALKAESPVNVMADVVAPRAELPRLLSTIHTAADRSGIRVVCFGHAGDGNVHVNILKDDLPMERWEAGLPGLLEEIYRLAISLGGAITGEHGVGATRRSYLPLALDAHQIALERRLKEAFDPNGILNPGKIFP